MVVLLVVLQNCQYVLLQELASLHRLPFASSLNLEVNLLVLVDKHLCYF